MGLITGVLVVGWVLSTMLFIVPAGFVGVPVTLGSAGSPVGQGFHITAPFTTMKTLSTRTTSYTMAASISEGSRSGDDSVKVLGSDGASGSVDSTILFRIEADRATDVYEELGTSYVITLIRPSARTCIRSEFTEDTMVEAATTAWHDLEDRVTACMSAKMEGRGIVLEDFQLREVILDPSLQAAVTAKVAAQQDAERQAFERIKAEQQADITRVEALATADSQQILACGGRAESVTLADGTTALVAVPNPIDQCSQSQLTPAYLQFTYIQALKALVNSPNNSTIILPFDENLTPLLTLPTGSQSTPVVTADPTATTSTSTATTTTAPGG